MKRVKQGILFIILGIFLFVGGYIAVICVPSEWYKVTDAHHPDFNPEKFSYRDYRNEPMKLREAFRVMFPQGTSKEYVDRILIQGADFRQRRRYEVNGYYLLIYSFPKKYFWKGAPSFRVVYDQDENLVQINYPYLMPLYEADVTYDELMDIHIEQYKRQFKNDK